MSEDVFAKALRNFTMDAAAGDAIRHLTDKGYTPTQIKETLTFPAPMEYIVRIMWERLVETRVIVLEESLAKHGDSPSVSRGATGKKGTVPNFPKSENEKLPRDNNDFGKFGTVPFFPESGYEIVERVDRYGKKSFLKVKKESPEEVIFSPEDYVLCDYGRRIANGEVFENEFIAMLPWPDKPVWVLSKFPYNP